MTSPLGAWWPIIKDAESAKAAARSSSRVIAFLAVIVGIGAALSFTGKYGYANIKGWGLAQSAILALVAFRVGRLSRGFAVFGLVVSLVEFAWIGLERGIGGKLVLFALLVIVTNFVTSVRATLAYHRYRVQTDDSELPDDWLRVTSVAALLGIVVGFLSFVGRTQIYGCFFLDPTPKACDRFGWGGDSPETRIRRANDAFNRWVNDDARFKEWWRNYGTDPANIQALTVRGMRRLSYDELREWNRIRLAMANASPAACEMLWTGAVDERAVSDAMGKLSQADITSWYRLLYLAGSRQIPAGTNVPSRLPEDESTAEEGLKFVIDSLEPGSARDAFRAQIASAGELRGVDACGVFKTVFTSVERMPRELGSRFLRANASALGQ